MLNRRQASAALLATLAAACSPKTSAKSKFVGTQGQPGDALKVGHLVGICMAPLFYADAKKFFSDEGLNVQLAWMPNPGDAVTALAAGSLDFIHNPFTNTFVAADNGARVKIIAGSGNEGLSCVACAECRIHSVADLKAHAGKGLKVGSERINTLELMFYRTIRNVGLSYSDFDMVWFHDHFAMLSAFQLGEIDVVTHVEPFVSELLSTGAVDIANSRDTWGELSPDCVVSARTDFIANNPDVVKRYLRAILRADHEIKADMPRAADVLDAGKYYKVSKQILLDAMPRQPPGVDLTKSVGGMNRAITDMLELKYLKKPPENVVDLTLLREVLAA